MQGIDLNSLMLFHAVVTAGSIRQAEERLGVPKATVSRRLRELEKQIGAVLLKRGRTGLTLTDAGAVLLGHCERIAAETRDLNLTADGLRSEVSGVLRVALPIGFGSAFVSRALAAFALRYPQVRLQVDVTARSVDVNEEPYDIAIHVGRPPNENLPSRLLAELPRAAFASPAYLQRRATPTRSTELADHDCIALSTQIADGLWNVTAGSKGARISITPRVIVSDIGIARDMAVGGVGITVLPTAYCEPDVKAGRLMRVLPAWSLPPARAIATYLERRHLPVRVRAFLELLKEQF